MQNPPAPEEQLGCRSLGPNSDNSIQFLLTEETEHIQGVWPSTSAFDSLICFLTICIVKFDVFTLIIGSYISLSSSKLWAVN